MAESPGVPGLTWRRSTATSRASRTARALCVGDVDAICEAAESMTETTRVRDLGVAAPIACVLPSQESTDGRSCLSKPMTPPAFSARRDARVGRPLLLAAHRHKRSVEDLTLEQILRYHRHRQDSRDPGYVEPILQTALDGYAPSREHRRRPPRCNRHSCLRALGPTRPQDEDHDR